VRLHLVKCGDNIPEVGIFFPEIIVKTIVWWSKKSGIPFALFPVYKIYYIIGGL